MNDDAITGMLNRRGFEVLLKNPVQYLFFPPGLGEAFEEELYRMLKKYSFRIFIRDVIKNRKAFRAEHLLKYSTRQWVDEYLEFLCKRGVIEEAGQGDYRLKATAVFSFGDTLEWFVAKVFEKEFASAALWGVRLKGAGFGGDYDVVASVEGRLAYVEVKSSPPKNIEETEISAFMKRTEALRPSFAVFLEDTRLRLGDKIVPFFESALKGKGRSVERVEEGVYSMADKVFIISSKPDIVTNLALCVRRHLTPGPFF